MKFKFEYKIFHSHKCILITVCELAAILSRGVDELTPTLVKTGMVIIDVLVPIWCKDTYKIAGWHDHHSRIHARLMINDNCNFKHFSRKNNTDFQQSLFNGCTVVYILCNNQFDNVVIGKHGVSWWPGAWCHYFGLGYDWVSWNITVFIFHDSLFIDLPFKKLCLLAWFVFGWI